MAKVAALLQLKVRKTVMVNQVMTLVCVIVILLSPQAICLQIHTSACITPRVY